MTERQLATLESLRDQIEAIWIKMGGKYEEMGEPDLHVIAHKKGITSELRSSYKDYATPEAQRAIGFLIKLKAGYQRTWTKQWQSEVAEREAEKHEDEGIQKECMTFDLVKEWMLTHSTFYEYIPCYFEFVKKIDGIGYWRKRETVFKLFSRWQAEQKMKSLGLDTRGVEFYSVFDPWHGPGHDGTLYTPKSEYEAYV